VPAILGYRIFYRAATESAVMSRYVVCLTFSPSVRDVQVP